MRFTVIGLLLLTLPCSAQEKTTPSALESDPDPKAWFDLMPTKTLQGWKRVPLAPDEKLADKNPWSLDETGKLLLCDGVGIKEMFLHDREFTDGVFHVEWRFRPVTDGKKDYNSGVYVRSAATGKTWLQVQVAHLEKPPFLGDMFADVETRGKVQRVIIRGDGDKRAKKPGEWNTYEITTKGKNVSVWINGAVTTTWDECPFPRGRVGLQAEHFFIEFRNLKFKELK